MTVVADARVAAYWARQVTALAVGLERICEGDQTAVHPSRVAVRRLRSTLRTFAELFTSRAVETLDHELNWLAIELGSVRDREVIRDILNARADLVDPLRTAVLDRLDGQLQAGMTHVRRTLQSERAEHLVARLDATVDDPRTDDLVDLEPFLARARRILGKRLCRAGIEDDPERLHSARKAGKRVRYAAEVVAGDMLHADLPLEELDPEQASAVEQVRRLERLQDDLGHYQDLVTARSYLISSAEEDPGFPVREAFALARTLAEEQLRTLVLIDRTGVCPDFPRMAAVSSSA